MKKISDAELEVMKIIWKKNATTSLEIIKELQHSKWKENTIRTLINRLIAKKAIGISKREGKTYTYVPLIKENEYRTYATNKLLKQLFHGSSKEFLSFLIENDRNCCEEISRFLKNLGNIEK